LLTIDTPQNVMDNPTVQSAYLGAELWVRLK
jgi:ABC-type branched-subunit amino acid transport system ATPase component